MEPDTGLEDLEQQRNRLYDEMAATGDFRRGSVTENYRRCGKSNCACAQPDHPGHGPRWLWTRSETGGKTVGRQLSPEEVDKVRDEIANHQRFVEISREVVEVNEAICEARPPGDVAHTGDPDEVAETEKGGSTGSSSTS